MNHTSQTNLSVLSSPCIKKKIYYNSYKSNWNLSVQSSPCVILSLLCLVCCCWSLLLFIWRYSPLSNRFTVLLLHVLLNECILFVRAIFNIHRSSVLTALFGCCMAGATWNCCHLGERSVYTIQLCISLLHSAPHEYSACVFSCNLPPALLAEWLGSFTSYCGNTGVEQIPKLESAQKVDPGEENCPATSIRTQTYDF